MNNEEKILTILETIVAKVDKLEQGQAKLEQEVKGIKLDVKTIKKDVKELKSLSNEAFKDILMLDLRTDNLRGRR